jgi:hypothetical protein
MTRAHTGVLVLSLGGITSLAFAQPPADKPDKAPAAGGAAPEAALKPSPELDTLYKGYQGNWKCETTFQVGAMGPGSPEMKSTATVKIQKDKDLNGFWYRGDYQVKKTKAFPGMRAGFALGYDAASKTALFMAADSMGGNVNAAATGATGESVSFVGDGYMNGQKVKMKQTMSRKSDKEVEHSIEVDTGKGFQSFIKDECKK